MVKRAWYYERQATEANAREAYYRNRVPPEASTIESRGAAKDYIYNSMIVKDGAAHRSYIVSVPDATTSKVTPAQAGLALVVGDGDGALSIRGSGIKPTRVHWYAGDATPTRRRTPWNTSVARYYASTGGQSHFSIPFSKATGAFTPADITTAFNAVFGSGAPSRGTLLGTTNGRAYISWETARVSAQT